ncbi:MAG: 4-alpha-glucanotransferase, partial [Actinobacteria bacterium]|nr:4-alpha-glucanotransferase [Actinomycetota bacterium]
MTGFLNKRSSGLLLHISSLPSGSGTGDFGRAAYKFIDFLEKSRQSYWQVLPLNPTTALKAYSPYAPLSAFAGNTLFINHRILYEDNLIKKEDTGQAALADFKLAGKIRGKLLGIAYEKFKSGTNASLKNEFEAFCLNNRKWLDDYAAFKVFHD